MCFVFLPRVCLCTRGQGAHKDGLLGRRPHGCQQEEAVSGLYGTYYRHM